MYVRPCVRVYIRAHRRSFINYDTETIVCWRLRYCIVASRAYRMLSHRMLRCEWWVNVGCDVIEILQRKKKRRIIMNLLPPKPCIKWRKVSYFNNINNSICLCDNMIYHSADESIYWCKIYFLNKYMHNSTLQLVFCFHADVIGIVTIGVFKVNMFGLIMHIGVSVRYFSVYLYCVIHIYS